MVATARSPHTEPLNPNLERLPGYPAGVARSLVYPNIAAWGLLAQAHEDFPNRIACHACERTLTYADIWRDSLKIAAILHADGIAPGDRVGILRAGRLVDEGTLQVEPGDQLRPLVGGSRWSTPRRRHARGR